MHRSRLAALQLLAVLVLPLWAADSTLDDHDHNARLLEKWRSDPEHYARLQRDLNHFWSLPRAQQEKLRRFDRELYECDSETQKRLWETLERYSAWLEQLPEAERQRILAIADKQERLKAIKQKRDQQWLERLPAKEREYLKTLPDDERPAATARLQQEDRERRLKWQTALRLRPDLRPRPSNPKTFADFPPEVVDFVNDLLTPMLTAEEKEQLKTQGWPALAQMVLDLSERHPVLPPVNSIGSVVRYDQLPMEFKRALPKKQLENKNQWTGLVKQEGRWPDFALAFTDLATKSKHTLPRTLGASKPADFSPDIQDFIKERLLSTIATDEALELARTEGKWPEYPKMLHQLAKKYNLVIPGMSLPGPRELWESARTAVLPEVPDRALRQFVGELSKDELRNLNLSPMDPSSRDRLRQEYFKRHPKELKRLRDLDQTLMANPKNKPR